MANQEIVADIIAEMRALSNPISDGIIAINGQRSLRASFLATECAFVKQRKEARSEAV